MEDAVAKAQQGVDLADDPIALQRLREASEEAKIELSEVKETHIVIEADMVDARAFDDEQIAGQLAEFIDGLKGTQPYTGS